MEQPDSSQYSASGYLGISAGAVLGFAVLLALVVTGAVFKENVVIRQARRRTKRASRKRVGVDNPTGPEAHAAKNPSDVKGYEEDSPSTQRVGHVSEPSTEMMGWKKNCAAAIYENIEDTRMRSCGNQKPGSSNEGTIQNDVSSTSDRSRENVASDQTDDNSDAESGNYEETDPNAATLNTSPYPDLGKEDISLQSAVTEFECKTNRPVATKRKQNPEETNTDIKLQSLRKKDPRSTGQDDTDQTQ